MGSGDKFYITTAIPYVNARPHIGFAMEIIQTDAFARYRRLRGSDVRFLTGTDDNSLSNVQAAEAEGIPTQDLVDRNSQYFSGLKELLDISFDDFIRTSVDPRHLDGARKLWEACDRSGDIYKKSYSGLYCISCEQFYSPAELDNGLCPEHGIPVEQIDEENYFFKLTDYAERLEKLISSDELRVIPKSRKNEVLSFIRMGLEDFSISRSKTRGKGWGVPVPGDEEQVMYVWFDALSNYINALGFADNGELYGHYWLDNPNRVHVIGKGIIRFHAVYWPAMLMSAGIPLPTTLFVHGYVTLEGEKLSKTKGIVIDPSELVDEFGVDAVRYYLLRRIHPTEDGNFSREHFVRTFNSDLADQLGNLLSRVIGMVDRYYEGSVPAPSGEDPADSTLKKMAEDLLSSMDDAMERYAPNEALAAIWELIAEANRYVVEVKPWTLAKVREQDESAEKRLSTALYNLVEVIRIVAVACSPFIPKSAAAIGEQLGISLEGQSFGWGEFPVGGRLSKGDSLFPKLEVSAEAP